MDTLNFWLLEQPNWPDYYGDPARGFTNLNTVPSWDYTGTALSVDTNVPAYLKFLQHERLRFATPSVGVQPDFKARRFHHHLRRELSFLWNPL